MGNSVGEGIWDSHPVVKKDAKKSAKRNRSGLTAKETKIVSKKSRLFDSKTQGIGLPQKSSKETITGRKPGKPKPTAGKGINKNIITKGGKAGRAIENKMRSAMKLPKGITTGKAKAVKKVAKFASVVSKEDNIKLSKNNKVVAVNPTLGELMRIVGKNKNVSKGNLSPRIEKNPKPSRSDKKLIRDELKFASGSKRVLKSRTPKVPVKPKGGRGLRGGGMLGGGGLFGGGAIRKSK